MEIKTKQIDLGNNAIFEMILVKGGTFYMGVEEEQLRKRFRKQFFEREKKYYTKHKVTITKDYYIAKYPITQAQWIAVMGYNPSKNQGKKLFKKVPKENHPIENINYFDCERFFYKVNKLLGKSDSKSRLRLPTEAEWTFAAKGGVFSKGYLYSGSNNPSEVAWCMNNSGKKNIDEISIFNTDNEEFNDRVIIKENKCSTHAVGLKKPNELGIYDMSGNVDELCNDWYSEFECKDLVDPQGPNIGMHRVVKGGSCYDYSFYSTIQERSNAYSILGFRVAMGTD